MWPGYGDHRRRLRNICRGIATSALKDNEDIIEPLECKGSLVVPPLHDVYDPITEQLIVAGTEEISL
jgi:DNA-directed RNA polymerase subunit beta'